MLYSMPVAQFAGRMDPLLPPEFVPVQKPLKPEVELRSRQSTSESCQSTFTTGLRSVPQAFAMSEARVLRLAPLGALPEYGR